MGDRPRHPIAFQTPDSVDAAEARLATLRNNVDEIQAQLADRNRTDAETGRRISAEAFHSWRRKAIFATGSVGATHQ